jgi:hypothetical protein
MSKKTMSKEEINEKCKLMVEKMVKFFYQNRINIGTKVNSSGLHITYIDSFYVRNQDTTPPGSYGKPRGKDTDDSCFGAGLTNESALLDLATLIEGETIYNPYTKQSFEVPRFAD